VKIVLLVEGGGDTPALQSECRKGFRLLLEKAGFQGRMPEIVACGSRNQTFKDFKVALQDSSALAMMLIDSEDPVVLLPWSHLKTRDGWVQPSGTSENQVQFMTTCMETWLMADPETLTSFFGDGFKAGKLLPIVNLESRPRDKVQDSLVDATRDCGRVKKYQKGKRSFQVLAKLNPSVLLQLKYFKRLVDELNALR
jgi:hypothetical protein